MPTDGYRIMLLNWRDSRNPLAGGAEVHIWEVFGRLAARGWVVEALCAHFRGAPREEVVGGIRVRRIAPSTLYHLALPQAYRVAARERKPHIVVDFMNKLPLYSPLFVRAPLCCFVHHLFGSSAVREVGLLAGLCVWSYERPVPWVYRNTRFATGSESSIQELRGLGLRNVEGAPMPYGVDTQQFRPGARATDPILLYLGRLKRYKNVDHLIDVLPALRIQVPGLQVHIAGTGDARPGLEELARRRGVSEFVTFHGFVSEQEKLQLYQQAWVTCLPSFKEGFGLTIPEAALCATPTVGYDVPGLRDAIEPDKTGLLVSYGDRDALATALARILTDDSLRERLGNAARAKYLGFTWDAAADRMEAYLRQVIREESPGHG